MSRYLIDRIAALLNVELHTRTEVIGLEGDEASGLTGAVFRDRGTGATHSSSLRHLFLFIGADPNAAWLQDCVAVDDKGFVLTGVDSTEGQARPAGPCCRSKPANRACSLSAMYEPAQPSVLRRR
ncbi:MAG: hypothetical protein WA884_03605 [Methyloceanibacter sp.]